MRKRSLSLSQGNYLIGAVELHHRKTKVTGGGLLKACALYLIGLHIYCWLEFDYCQCAFFGVCSVCTQHQKKYLSAACGAMRCR